MLTVLEEIKFELENFVREIETAQRSWGRAIPGSEEKACEGPEARLRGRTSAWRERERERDRSRAGSESKAKARSFGSYEDSGFIPKRMGVKGSHGMA